MNDIIYYLVIIFAVLGTTGVIYLFGGSLFGISLLSQGLVTEKSSKKAHNAGLYCATIYLIFCASFVFLVPKAKADCDEIYLKVGAGYKFDETEYIAAENTGHVINIHSDPISARVETGVECGSLTYGISHHSQWRTGFPFNDTKELHKTEFFVDYKFSWGI